MSNEAPYLISKFIEPDPVVFTRLAGVNRSFYNVFTNDEVWKPLDVYNVGSDVFRHFLSKGNFELMRWYWADAPKRHNPEVTENKYAKLGAALRGFFHQEIWIPEFSDSDDIFIAADSIKFPLLRGAAAVKSEDGRLVIRDGKTCHFKCKLSSISSVDYWRELIKSRKWMFARHPFQYAPDEILENKEIADLVREECPEAVLFASRDVIASYDFSRDQALELIEGKIGLVKKFPQYADDKEFIMRALKISDDIPKPLEYYDIGRRDQMSLYYRELSSEFREDPDLVEALIKAIPLNLEEIPRKFLDDKLAGKTAATYLKSYFCEGLTRELHLKKQVENPEVFEALVGLTRPRPSDDWDGEDPHLDLRVLENDLDQYQVFEDSDEDDFDEEPFEDIDIEDEENMMDRPLRCIYNKRFMRDQIKRNPNAFNFLCDELQNDKEFLDLALAQPGEPGDLIFRESPPGFLRDKDDLLKVFETHPRWIARRLTDFIDEDETLIHKFIESGVYDSLPSKIKVRDDVALAALDKDPDNYDLRLLNTGKYSTKVLEAILNKVEIWRHVNPKFINSYWDLVVKRLGLEDGTSAGFRLLLKFIRAPKFYQELPKAFKDDVTFSIAAVRCRSDDFDQLPIEHAIEDSVQTALNTKKLRMEDVKQLESECKNADWYAIEVTDEPEI